MSLRCWNRGISPHWRGRKLSRAIHRQRSMEIWEDLISKCLHGEQASPFLRGSCWKSLATLRRTGRGGQPLLPDEGPPCPAPAFSHLEIKAQLMWPLACIWWKLYGPQIHFVFSNNSQFQTKAVWEKRNSLITSQSCLSSACFQFSLVPKAPIPWTQVAGWMTSSCG